MHIKLTYTFMGLNMKKGMTIIYPEYNGLYINLTNRCPCSCTFCIRQKASGADNSHSPAFYANQSKLAYQI